MRGRPPGLGSVLVGLLTACAGGGGGGALGGGDDAGFPYPPRGTIGRATTAPWEWIRDHASLPAGCGVQDNRWNQVHVARGAFGQRVFVEMIDGTPAFGWQWFWPRSPEVVTYPEVICGTKPWDMGTRGYAKGGLFPLQPSAHSLSVSYDVALRSTGMHNLTFTMWAVSDDARPLATISNEIMVWIHSTPGMKPAGAPVGTAASGEARFEVWVNPKQIDHSGSSEATWAFVAFVPERPLLSGTLDVTPLLDYLRTHDLPGSRGQPILPASAWIGALELGTEIVGGGGLVEVTGFSIRRGDR